MTNHLNKKKSFQRIYVDDRPFTIGQVFDPESSQDDVYSSIKQLVRKFLDGYSCNVMAYGQSGTGKSYTMGLQAEVNNIELTIKRFVFWF